MPSTLHFALSLWPRFVVAGGVLAFGVARSNAGLRRRMGETPWDVLAVGIATQVAAVMVASAMLLGALGWLHDWIWAVLACAVFLMIGRLPVRPGAPTTPLEGDGPLPSMAFSIVLGGAVLGRMLFSLRNPPADWDSFHYHLPMVAYWMQTGTLGAALRDPTVFGLYFPGNGEILQMWAGMAAGRETLMPWMSALSLGLLGLAVRRLGLLVGARAAVAEAVALAVTMAPGLLQLTLGTRIDDPLAMWFGVALLFAVRARRGVIGPQLGLMLLALGLLAGTKGTGPVYAALIMVVALTGRRAGERVRAVLHHPLSLVAALLTGGFWMARNAWVAGNPLFPAEVRIGPWVLPGLMNTHDQALTSQVVLWMHGYGGHNTPVRLWSFYGIVLPALALGVVVWFTTRSREPGGLVSTAPRDGARTLFVVAAACTALYLFGPFSGSYEPPIGGHAPRLNLDNLRLMAPTVVAFAPLAAAGLSRLPFPTILSVLLGLLVLVPLRRMAGHLVPGMVVLAVALPLGRLLARRAWPLAARALAVVVLAGIVALAVARVEPARQRVFEQGWDAYASRIHNLSSAALRDLRARAAGRPMAVAGVDAWWGYYGRDFSGRPMYVPVGRRWEDGISPWDFHPDARARADRAVWLDNLAHSGAAVLVIGSPGEWCRQRYVEGDWVMGDSARFARVAAQHCDTAYVVRGAASPAAEGAR